ncbi:ferritin-like domain-containing protein [Nocardia niwae]|uniref:Ferritin-like domain-containing protein n=1 Tax=Nocardia niwae TaxID=626084 RepID=A0ABV2XKR7_9NOCA|nr:ferritin-like domain-containing protein [Nocardia niwae]
MTEDEREALVAALNAEYGAVYAYGVIAAYASPERARLVAEHTAAHRARRDTTVDALALSGATAPPSDAAYIVPFAVTDPISAARLAVAVESDTAVAWRSVVERGASMAIRRSGVDALTDAAVRLATWQSILGANPPTVAFPGKA